MENGEELNDTCTYWFVYFACSQIFRNIP